MICTRASRTRSFAELLEAARLIPIGATHRKICEAMLEPLSLPVGIDRLALSNWNASGWESGARGVYGLPYVGLRVGAHCWITDLGTRT